MECKACSEVDNVKLYYNPTIHECVECLTDDHCENEEVCSSDNTCVCELTQGDCPNTDFNADACLCCLASTPVYDSASETCKTCAEVDSEKPYYNSATHECVECLTDGDCTNGVCIDNVCYPCREVNFSK